MNSAANCRCCGRRPIRRAVVAGRGRAPHACRGGAVCCGRFHHADGGGRGRGRGRNSRRDAGAAPAYRAPTSTMAATSRCILPMANDFTVGLIDRPDAYGLMRTADHRRLDDPTRGIATSGRHGRSFSLGYRRRRDRVGADRHRRPTRPRPSSPTRSICRGIPPLSAVRPTNCSRTAISARGW